MCQSVLFCLFGAYFGVGTHVLHTKSFRGTKFAQTSVRVFYRPSSAKHALAVLPKQDSRYCHARCRQARYENTEKTKRKDNSNTRVCNAFHIVISESSSGRARYTAKPTQLLPFTMRRQAFTATSPERKAAVVPTATADHCTEA